MPRFAFIDADAVPVSRHTGSAPVYRAECKKYLRDAITNGKALVIRLGDGERAERYRDYLRHAAKDLGVQLLVTTGDTEPRTMPNGKVKQEARSLYVRIFRLPAPQSTAQPIALPAPTAAPGAPRGPLDGFKMPTEPRRIGRPPKPKPPFTIPTADPGYRDLGHGIAVDR